MAIGWRAPLLWASLVLLPALVDARPSQAMHRASLAGLYTFAFAIFGVTGVQFYMLATGKGSSLIASVQDTEVPVIFGDSRAHRDVKYRSSASDEARRELLEKRKEQYASMPDWLRQLFPAPREGGDLYQAPARAEEEPTAEEGSLMWYVQNDLLYKRVRAWMRSS